MSKQPFGEHALPVGEGMRCPDGGTCHHSCVTFCFRVDHAGPLSGVFPNDEWPDGVGSLAPYPPQNCAICGAFLPHGDIATCGKCGVEVERR